MSVKLTVPEIAERHPDAWFALTHQQRLFVLKYISDGQYNAVASARGAYPRVKDIKVWASRLLANRHIKKVLALHLGLSDTEVVLSDIRALVKRSKRKGANLDILLAPWLRAACALEALVARETPNV